MPTGSKCWFSPREKSNCQQIGRALFLRLLNRHGNVDLPNARFESLLTTNTCRRGSSTISIVMNEPKDNSTAARIEQETAPDDSLWRQLACSGSVFLWLAILVCLVTQPDILAAVTLVPPWCWVVVGVVLALLGYQRASRRWSLLAIVLWVAFASVFIDETHGLWRAIGRQVYPANVSNESEKPLRVISLNCANKIDAARELTQFEPDIVLLQESPGREQVAELANTLFGESGNFLHTGDASIIASGTFSDLTSDNVSHFAHARVLLNAGPELDVISLRLAPPVSRVDFWSQKFWTEHRDRRADHRTEVNLLLHQLHRESAKRSVVLGGDFNTTPIDLVLNDLRTLLFDTFRAAGQGLGNTGTNQYPLFRVDQIWASRDIDAVSSVARRSSHSDHRMVISELRFPAEAVE